MSPPSLRSIAASAETLANAADTDATEVAAVEDALPDAANVLSRIPTRPRFARTPLGQMLVESGVLSPADKLRTLSLQSRVQARLGHILLSQGLIDKAQLYATIARQFDTDVADFATTPPDIRLMETIGVARCLSQGILPWQRRAGRVLIATARPEEFAEHESELETLFGPIRMVITSELDIHQAVLTEHPNVLSDRAENRVPDAESCRAWANPTLLYVMAALFAALIVSAVLVPTATLLVLIGWAVLTLVSNSTLKLTAVARQILDARAAPSDDVPPHN